jgi:hypothetical protein
MSLFFTLKLKQMKLTIKIFIIVAFTVLNSETVNAQKNLEKIIADSLTSIANSYAAVGRVQVAGLSVNAADKQIVVDANDLLSQIPFRPDNVKRIYAMLSKLTASRYPGYKIICRSDKLPIDNYIPNAYRTNNQDKLRTFGVTTPPLPLVSNLSRPYKINAGLQSRHIALWQSHGLFYNQNKQKWTWQRGRLFNTVEDLYTQSYVLPFLVPMLENAGANVLLPRERDTQTHEIIVDNDMVSRVGGSRFHDYSDRKPWIKAEPGFANPQKQYLSGENPFTMGSYLHATTITDSDELNYAEWVPNIPDEGYYAVYVAYKSLPNSAPDARYTIFHLGGQTHFSVNQNLCGGTWVYLGRFRFPKGRNTHFKVMMSNFSSFPDKVVTADAVKIGGGMGNIARNNYIPEEILTDSLGNKKNVVEVQPASTSKYPRYTEGARYWLQWAGVPDSIYNRTKGKNDYSDDFQSRGFWVNYLAGGSSVIPGQKGLNVPLDMALAFHTDAGFTKNDSIIGTLGICTVNNTAGSQIFANGYSRWISRDLTDIIQSQITDDIRRSFAPEWTRRGLWNKSYSEARVPEVPTMLLELLAHQNFADMRYGLDPRFRFVVSRAIYKGILKYLSVNSDRPYVVQPLPVTHFSTRFVDKNKVELRWSAAVDTLEPTAVPERYVVYTRADEGGFNNGLVTANNRIVIEIQPGKIYSFKVTALNKGGESFPSEILPVYRANNNKPEVMIVNGFSRISAPGSFNSNGTAGFKNDEEPGVPYISDYAYVGKQYDFNRSSPYLNDDEPGFGASYANFETKEIAGNTFDFPYLHGTSVKAAGFSFVSSSADALMRGDIELKRYKITDVILGKQKQTTIGNRKKVTEFKTFPLALQQCLRNYCQAGGSLLVSGAFIGSDFYEGNYIRTDERLFVETFLKYKLKMANACLTSEVKMVSSPFPEFSRAEFEYYAEPNEASYFAGSVDAIEPAGEGAVTICRYSGTNMSAGVAYRGRYRVCSFGFPLEVIRSERERNKLMYSVLNFLNSGNK